MQPTPASLRRVRTWAVGALRLEEGRAWTPEPAAEAVPDLLDVISRHRLGDLIGSQADGLWLPDQVRTRLEELRIASRRAVLVQMVEIDRLSGIFAAHGLPYLVIKGPVLAVQSAGDPTARGAGDIDLVVAPTQVEDAHRLLTSNGWAMRVGTEMAPGTWAWRHALKASNAFAYAGPGSKVDLHWRLDPTLHALPTFAEVWERREFIEISGISVPTLGRGDVLAHTNLHAAKDSWRWIRSLVDVHRLARDPQIWEQTAAIAPLRRLEISTLAVTRFVLGLPPTVPTEIVERLDRVPASVISRATTAQAQPAYATFPFPGAETSRLLRYMVMASTTPRDIAHSLVSTAIPVKAVVGIDVTSAWTGVPLTLGHRLLRLRRRVVALVRREPGAGVDDAVVKVRR